MTKRDTYLRRTYGITEADYNDLLKRQGGRCPVCLRTPKQVGKTFHVDHDHKTREIRGILCGNCNHRVIGRHRLSDLLIAAGRYLAGPFTGWFMPVKPKKKRKKRGN